MTGAADALFLGRFRVAAAHAQDRLASDCAPDAATLLLRIRLEQGWYGDAVALARERFRAGLPATRADRIASVRMHVARVCGGAELDDAVRMMQSIAGFARDAGDPWLEALARESIAKVTLMTWRLEEREGLPALAMDLYRPPIALYAVARDERAGLTCMLQLGTALGTAGGDGARGFFAEVAVAAADAGLRDVELAAKLRMAGSADAAGDEDLDGILAEYDALPSPLGRARVLRQKVTRAFARGRYDERLADEAREIFRSEGALLDLSGFCNQLAESTYAKGKFAAATDAARESLAAGAVMPFPYGEAAARLMLASSLQQQGRYAEAAAEFERIHALPPRYRRKRHLDVLPYVSFFLQVNQAEKARAVVLEYLSDIGEEPTYERKMVFYYLAIANMHLRRWPEVFSALEQSAAVAEARGELADAAMKRVEIAEWRVNSAWMRGTPVPPEVIEAAFRTFDEEERRLERLPSDALELVELRLHQLRAMTWQAAGRPPEALRELEKFREVAVRTGSRVHETNYHRQAGLILHKIGTREAAVLAQRHLDTALEMLLETNAPDAVANAAYLAASNELELVRWTESYDEAQAHVLRAVRLLESADRRIAELQTAYIEPGAEASQKARIAIHEPWKKVYDFAVPLLLRLEGGSADAFSWIEKWKGRALLVALGLRPLPPPQTIPADVVRAERAAVEEMAAATTYSAIVEARDRLQEAWRRLAEHSEAAEYLSLRTGQPVGLAALRDLLAGEERQLATASRR